MTIIGLYISNIVWINTVNEQIIIISLYGIFPIVLYLIIKNTEINKIIDLINLIKMISLLLFFDIYISIII
jgi:hypothetical protein